MRSWAFRVKPRPGKQGFPPSPVWTPQPCGQVTMLHALTSPTSFSVDLIPKLNRRSPAHDWGKLWGICHVRSKCGLGEPR